MAKEKTSRYRHNLDDILNLANYSALQEALTAGQFCIYFQPKISLDTEEFIGSEALIRYINQAGEIIAPNNFIPILEEARLIKMLDLYVFEEVCKQINIWKERKNAGQTRFYQSFTQHSVLPFPGRSAISSYHQA